MFEIFINEKCVFLVVEVLGIFQDVFVGFEVVYQVGVIYWDIKLVNFVVIFEWVKIMDFGIVLVFGDDVVLIQLGQVMGLFLFMLFEQIQGFEFDVWSDFYFFGVVCFIFFVGWEFFIGKMLVDVVLKYLGELFLDFIVLCLDFLEDLVVFVE